MRRPRRLWGKARSFLEASLSFEESRAARVELARLAERLGESDEAQRHFRRAAEQLSQSRATKNLR